MSQYRENNIKVLSEQLEFLQTTEEASEQITEYKDEMFIVLVGQNNGQAELLKNMVSDPGWFDGNRTKFEDW